MQFENYSNFKIIRAIDKIFKSERECQVSFILLLSEVVAVRKDKGSRWSM
jgi:hypothetical protein